MVHLQKIFIVNLSHWNFARTLVCKQLILPVLFKLVKFVCYLVTLYV